MSSENKEKAGPAPKPADQRSIPVPRPTNPFERKPAYYKPDEVIKVWKPLPEKRDKD